MLYTCTPKGLIEPSAFSTIRHSCSNPADCKTKIKKVCIKIKQIQNTKSLLGVNSPQEQCGTHLIKWLDI